MNDWHFPYGRPLEPTMPSASASRFATALPCPPVGRAEPAAPYAAPRPGALSHHRSRRRTSILHTCQIG